MDLIRLRLMALLCTLALMGKYIFLFYCYYSICNYGIWHRFSRKVLWLEVASTNNSAAVTAGYYLLLLHCMVSVKDTIVQKMCVKCDVFTFRLS